MEEVIRVDNRFYVLATSSLADNRTRVLKYGETFAVFNSSGDLEPVGLGEQGIYHQDTRYLSRLVLRLGGKAPQLLRSTIRDDDAFFTAEMMSPDLVEDGQVVVPRGSIHVYRSKFLWKGVCYEQLRVTNYNLAPVETSITLSFASDFADIFEVRGTPPAKTGTLLPPAVGEDEVTLTYDGRDGQRRSTHVRFTPAPDRLTEAQATFSLSLARRQESTIYVAIRCQQQSGARKVASFDEALRVSTQKLEAATRGRCRVRSSNALFNDWLVRSESDLYMMSAGNPEGEYPYAGVPWFSTVFGRDGILTSRECLWLAPDMAQHVLQYLAKTQATEVDAAREAEPGKIIHEIRRGEMANLNEVPFGRYYGSVDATPLFVMLAGAYLDRTGDQEFIRGLWPHVLAALDWMDRYGDIDHDGFIEYQPHGPNGLVQQGWKDSADSISHADGTLAEPPIALCEVQGYVFAAKRAAAQIAERLQDAARAEQLRAQAEELRAKFEEAFWSDAIGTYAIALDGQKKRCEIRASNAGHCLFTRIAGPERAWRVMNSLMGPDLFCGWGVRTLGSEEIRYNPMAYHNGTVWPHDNALIARGLGYYGFRDEVLRVMAGLFETSGFMELHRLPELFCGFHRREDSGGPTLYPVACSPQAWAAGAVYLLLESCLGIEVRAAERFVRFNSPRLPRAVNDLQIENLRVGKSAISLSLWRTSADAVAIEVKGPSHGIAVDVVG